MTTIPCYNSDDDYYANFDDDYNVNENNDYDDGNNGVNHQTNEKDLTLEEYFRSLPPPTFTEYVDEELNNSSKNQSTTNNPDWQAEKWDNPIDWNVVGLAVDGAGWGVDFLTSLGKKYNPNKLSIVRLEESAAYNPVAKNLMDDIGRFGDDVSKSTGRTEPKNLTEKLAMEEVKSNPNGTTPPRMPPMSDTKNGWLAEDGWVKRVQNVNGVEIHYIENTKTGQKTDFKFKD